MRAVPSLIRQSNTAVSLPRVPSAFAERKNFAELGPMQQIIASRQERLVTQLVTDGRVHHVPVFAVTKNTRAIHKFVRASAFENHAVFDRRLHFLIHLLKDTRLHHAAFRFCRDNATRFRNLTRCKYLAANHDSHQKNGDKWDCEQLIAHAYKAAGLISLTDLQLAIKG